MNTVLIFTDTQCKHMVGCYGQPVYDTPNIDRLASEGIRFERAYTACPVCTPARGAIFSGLTPQVNGAWANNLAPHRHLPLLGEVFRKNGIRAGYTGKWHLDGSVYDGTGIPDGGFEPDWWYDRANLMADLPPELRDAYKMSTTADDLRRLGLGLEHIYGHRVTDRAVDFLERVGDDPFTLVVSYDEPHDPWISPPEYWEKFSPTDFPERPNYAASTEGKPELQQIAAADILRCHGAIPWEDLVAKRIKQFGCNSYIDREIGRVIDAVDRLHADDTMIIYTADHGDQLGSHGLHDKGAYMYEETTNIPFIVRAPGAARGAVSSALVSHLDILPTMARAADVEWPRKLPGSSLQPVLEDPAREGSEIVVVSFSRFEHRSPGRGGFFPIRCITDGQWKLVINLLDTDELYDLASDPYEMTNRIEDPSVSGTRDALHDRLLDFLEQSDDPMDSYLWGHRAWRQVRQQSYVPRCLMPTE